MNFFSKIIIFLLVVNFFTITFADDVAPANANMNMSSGTNSIVDLSTISAGGGGSSAGPNTTSQSTTGGGTALDMGNSAVTQNSSVQNNTSQPTFGAGDPLPVNVVPISNPVVPVTKPETNSGIANTPNFIPPVGSPVNAISTGTTDNNTGTIDNSIANSNLQISSNQGNSQPQPLAGETPMLENTNQHITSINTGTKNNDLFVSQQGVNEKDTSSLLRDKMLNKFSKTGSENKANQFSTGVIEQALPPPVVIESTGAVVESNINNQVIETKEIKKEGKILGLSKTVFYIVLSLVLLSLGGIGYYVKEKYFFRL